MRRSLIFLSLAMSGLCACAGPPQPQPGVSAVQREQGDAWEANKEENKYVDTKYMLVKFILDHGTLDEARMRTEVFASEMCTYHLDLHTASAIAHACQLADEATAATKGLAQARVDALVRKGLTADEATRAVSGDIRVGDSAALVSAYGTPRRIEKLDTLGGIELRYEFTDGKVFFVENHAVTAVDHI